MSLEEQLEQASKDLEEARRINNERLKNFTSTMKGLLDLFERMATDIEEYIGDVEEQRNE